MFQQTEKTKGRSPDYRANEGIAVWINQDKNKKPYLSIQIPLLGIKVNAFQVVHEKTEN